MLLGLRDGVLVVIVVLTVFTFICALALVQMGVEVFKSLISKVKRWKK